MAAGKLDIEALKHAARDARGLAMDAVQACSSGHLGLPLGCAELGAVLFGHSLRYYPKEFKWVNRDVFVLSAGHGSMFLYAWLFFSGFELTLDDIKKFRKFKSHTPGHPETLDAKGVEATTGPLGQGIANGVGYAVAMKMAAARFNTPDHQILDNRVVVLAGDGCMQEGISHEACAFAGHFQLDNLIMFYDSNDVTLDAMAKETQSEDTAKRFEAYGFEVQIVKEGHDMEALLKAYEHARNSLAGKPHLIIIKTTIAKGIKEVQGTQKGHGEAGAKYIDEARKSIGLPDEKFYVSNETKQYFERHLKRLDEDYKNWQKKYDAWKAANPKLADLLQSATQKPDFHEILKNIPHFPEDSKIATRKAGSEAIQPIAKQFPFFISGSADLHGSTLNYLNCDTDFNSKNHSGRNIRFGIREHGMMAICNGIAYHGLFRPSCATFLVFSDYCRPSIRLAALSHLPVICIFTHDSIGVGEDGPTHQPIETVSALRLIPNLDVIRPADPEETAGAFAAAMERTNGPTLLALTRQNVPLLTQIDVQTRREGVLKGAYIARKEETGQLSLILLSSGSELQHALEAAKQIGEGVRVVSVPCMERFNRQPEDYQKEVLPPSCTKRIAVEAGVSRLWYHYVGLQGRVIGVDGFGISAPGAEVMKHFGFTAENVTKVAKEYLSH